jgi:small subunit ribosomal protein S21
MLYIKVEGIPLDKALKVLKRKFDKTKVVRELRERKEFKKKSISRREEVRKAKYIQKKYGDSE